MRRDRDATRAPSSAVLLRLRDDVIRGDPERLCERLRGRLMCLGATEAICDVGALTVADLGTVNALARMHLVARRLGGTVRLRNTPRQLQELLDLAGLSLGVEAGW